MSVLHYVNKRRRAANKRTIVSDVLVSWPNGDTSRVCILLRVS